MEQIDELVIRSVEQRVFQPERLGKLLKEMLDHSQAGGAELKAEIARQKSAFKDTSARLKRIYDSIEAGLIDIQDPLLKGRIADLKVQYADQERMVANLVERSNLNPTVIDDAKISAFAVAVKQKLRAADPDFRRAWLRLFVNRVTVKSDEIRIVGSRQQLYSLVNQPHGFNVAMVPGLDREWRARRDSNC